MNFSIANWNFFTDMFMSSSYSRSQISITWFVKEERQFKMEFEYRSRVCPGSPRCLFTGSEADAFYSHGNATLSGGNLIVPVVHTRESHL